MAGTPWKLFSRVASGALLVLGCFGCIDWKSTTAAPEESVRRYIALVQTVDGTYTGTLVATAAPAPGSGAAVSAVLPSQVLRGGTMQATVSSPTLFNRVILSVPGNTDHWELGLPGFVKSVVVLMVISTEMPKTVFTLQIAGGSSTTNGPYQQTDLGVIWVGTGEIQTNVTWDSPADLDLHLIDPSGTEIYYGHRQSNTGGQLDLDSNAACGSDGPRAENVFWGEGVVVPHGEYILRVDNWSACNAQLTNYTVTINLKGQPPKIYTGTFTGAGTAGAAGAGKTIAVFSF
jgi:hypothetical protein